MFLSFYLQKASKLDLEAFNTNCFLYFIIPQISQLERKNIEVKRKTLLNILFKI